MFEGKSDKIIETENDSNLKEKSRKLSITEGSFFSLMDGFGLRYITPYALALGANNTIIGIISSLPSFIGNISQLYSTRLMEKTSRKKIVVSSVFTQALMWIPLLLIGFLYFYNKISSFTSSLLLMIIYTLLIIAGSFPSPAWASWMRDLVPEKQASYYGKRNMILGIVALASMLIGAQILDYFPENKFIGFMILFLIAFIGRSLSGYIFTKKYEPKITYEKGYYFSLTQFIKKMPFNNFGRFTIYIALFTSATAIASPFFAVYMLKHLNFSYTIFTLIGVSQAIATLAFVPLWGKFADKYGNIAVLKITGFFIPLIPLLWYFSQYVNNSGYFLIGYLLLTEFASGIVWSGFNLSATTFIVTAVTRERIGLCVAYYHIITSFGVLIGALLGGLISNKLEFVFGIKSILFIFVLSAVLRFIVYLAITPMIKEVKQVEKLDFGKVESMIKTAPLNIWGYIAVKRVI